jgi:putative transposase
MSRLARIVFPGFPHHVTQRGIRRMDIFRDYNDRRKFIELLAKFTSRCRLEIWAYCLMSNHLHLVVVPPDKDLFSAAMRDSLSDYARFFNAIYGYKGHLWQERFYSSVMGPDYLWNAVRYVERNPLRAGMVYRAEDYPWSSAAFHCGLRMTDPLVSPNSPLLGGIEDWSEWLRTSDDASDQLLRRNTKTGRPTTASKEFLQMLESRLGRRIIPLKKGRRPQTPVADSDGVYPLETLSEDKSDLSPN